jgi:uncharacterized membrane protein YsdA (DUF1294 family)
MPAPPTIRGASPGPFLDRIDLRVDVPAVSAADMIAPVRRPKASATVAARVRAAREIQRQRYLEPASPGLHQCRCGPTLIEQVVDPDKESQTLLLQAAERFNLSARAYHRVLKVARTLADLAGSRQGHAPAYCRSAELSAQLRAGLRWRTPERTLHAIDLAGGIAGGLVAQALLIHKTSKAGFALVTFGIALIHAVALTALLAGAFELG